MSDYESPFKFAHLIVDHGDWKILDLGGVPMAVGMIKTSPFFFLSASPLKAKAPPVTKGYRF